MVFRSLSAAALSQAIASVPLRFLLSKAYQVLQFVSSVEAVLLRLWLVKGYYVLALTSCLISLQYRILRGLSSENLGSRTLVTTVCLIASGAGRSLPCARGLAI